MNTRSVNRTQVLLAATFLLLVFLIVQHIWANWGLVTIHARQQPLGKVIASIQSQGHAKIETDLPSDTLVTMDCVKVPVADAIDTLSVVTESRWRLLYFVAGTRTALKTGELSWSGAQTPDGWKLLSFPMGNIASLAGDDAPTLDPRADVWSPRTAAPAPVQTFFLEAAQATNASFAFPVDWNPTVKSAPPSGTVATVLPKLVSAAGGVRDQVFYLSKSGQRGPRPPAANGNGGPVADLQLDPDLIAARTQGQINRLPEEKRADAQTAFDAENAFRKSLAGMDPDARRAAFLQHMQDPTFQQLMANHLDGQDGRMNHDQRVQHNQSYVNRKLTAMGKMP